MKSNVSADCENDYDEEIDCEYDYENEYDEEIDYEYDYEHEHEIGKGDNGNRP